MKMKEEFKGFSNYTNEEYEEIWRNAKIVVDTNILLSFYRLSKETREELYNGLRDVKERLWIPYQVAKEYFDNKVNVIKDSNTYLKKINEDITNKINSVINVIDTESEKRLKCRSELENEINKVKDKIDKILKKEREKNNFNEGDVEQLIFELFDNVLGDKIEDKEYNQVKLEGQRRFAENLPPGYKDNEKEENGDYYIFYSMIKYAQKNKCHIIFITDDTKEDWFLRISGELKGGRYELLNEFYKKTGKLLLIYTSEGFLIEYKKKINKNIKLNENTLDELKSNRNVSDSYDIEYINKIQSRNIIRIRTRELLEMLESLVEARPYRLIMLQKLERINKYIDNNNLKHSFGELDNVIRMLIYSYKENDEQLKEHAFKRIEYFIKEINNDIYDNQRLNNLRLNRIFRSLKMILRNDEFVNKNKILNRLNEIKVLLLKSDFYYNDKDNLISKTENIIEILNSIDDNVIESKRILNQIEKIAFEINKNKSEIY